LGLHGSLSKIEGGLFLLQKSDKEVLHMDIHS